jgi:long-subunit acyl-CoA synthetase (AMP-forming)
VEKAIVETNARLPDYARVHRWAMTAEPFAIANRQLTPNGRLRRDAIRAAYLETIESFYREDANVVS